MSQLVGDWRIITGGRWIYESSGNLQRWFSQTGSVVVIMKIPCMNKSMVIMNNGQLIINSLWSNSIHEQLFIKLLWTTDHAWTIGLSIWTIDHMANCSCMNKLFIIYEQLFIISKIVHKLFIAWTIGHSMDNPSDIHKILNGCFLLFRFITKFFLDPHRSLPHLC